MKQIKIEQLLTENEVQQYCNKNGYTLIMVSHADNITTLTVV